MKYREYKKDIKFHVFVYATSLDLFINSAHGYALDFEEEMFSWRAIELLEA